MDAHAISDRTAPTRLIQPSDIFASHFNRQSFELFHGLAHHPLFSLPRLLDLAKDTQKHRPGDLYYDAGSDVRVDQRWNQMGPKPPVEEALRRIDTSGAWITLHQSQKDPEFGQIFDQCMSDFQDFTGINVKEVMKVDDALIFITSPRRVTPYHIDRECNFLLQISGDKTIYVFDQNDRTVLPEQELERFWSVDNNAAVYKKHLQDRAKAYRLIPGNGVHIPVNAPHWAQNDNNVSVSLSVNFTWKDSALGNLYRANFWLRKLGVRPRPPGRSRYGDAIKNSLMAATFVPAAEAARRTVRQLRRFRGREVRK
jgi:hypothetical protein